MARVLPAEACVSGAREGRAGSACVYSEGVDVTEVQMPPAQMGTCVVIMGCFAALGAVGCAAGVATPAVGDLKPTASPAVPTATLAKPTPTDPADVLRQTV